MSKKIKFIGCFVCFIAVIVSAIFCFNLNTINVHATTSNPDITKSNYNSEDYNFDESLYNVILAIAQQLNCNQPLIVKGFDVDIFLKNRDPSYEPTYVTTGVSAPDYAENIAARNQIVSDLQSDVLDLTTGENARYNCLKNISTPIKSITGLNALSLSFIKKLYLRNNSIEKIEKTDLASLTGLQELYVNNNKLTQFELNSNINNLAVLNLWNNNLTKIDLSPLAENASVDVSFNRIEKIEDITFSSSKNLDTLDIEFNMLNNLSAQDIETLNSKVQTQLNVAVQGINTNKDLTAGDFVKVYNLAGNHFSNISIKTFYFEGSATEDSSSFYEEGEENLICTSNTQGEMFLPAGKVKVCFYSNETEVYNPIVLNVKLPQLKYVIKVNGKESSNTYFEDNFNVEFYFEGNENIPNLQTVLENATIKIYVNNKEASGNNVSVTNNGTFRCSAYAQFDGMESELINVTVTRKNLKGFLIGIVVIVIIFVVIAAGYYVFTWYRNGAMVAPLSEREEARLNRRKHVEEQEGKNVSMRGFGKERLFRRNEEDEVLNNLNSKEEVDSHYNSTEQGDYNEENYKEGYSGVGNNFERYNTEETKNGFDDEDVNNSSDNEYEYNDESNLNNNDGLEG